jgi:hypothetical protein
LKRLQELHLDKEKLEQKWVLGDGEENVKKMPRIEWDMIWWYYAELTRAIDSAIKYAPDDENDEL